MKVNIQKIAYRAIPVLTALVVLLSCVVVGNPVRAYAVTDVPLTSYKSGTTQDGEYRIVSATLPKSLGYVRSYTGSGWTSITNSYTTSVNLSNNSSSPRHSYFYIPGYSANDKFFSAGQFVDGSEFSVSYPVKFSLPDGARFSSLGDITASHRLGVAYYDKAGNHLGESYSDYVTVTLSGYSNTVEYTFSNALNLNMPYGCENIRIFLHIGKIYYRNGSADTSTLGITYGDVSIEYADWRILNYEDYAVNAEIDGDMDKLTLEFPLDICGVSTNDRLGLRYWPGQNGGYIDLDDEYGSTGYANIYCPGSWLTRTMIDASNIPNGSIAGIGGSLTLQSDDLVSGTVRAGVGYYDENFRDCTPPSLEVVQEFQLYKEQSTFDFDIDLTVNKPDGAKYLVFYCITYCEVDLDCTDAANIAVGFLYDVATLEMSVSSLYRLQEQTGQTNKLLDELINGTPEQGEAVNGAVNDMNNAAGELENLGNQLAAVDKPDLDSLDVSVNGLVPYQAMLAYTAPIQALWENPTLLGMLMIVVVLVIVSWVFFGKKG